MNRRMQISSEFEFEYCKFMKNYISRGHMRPLSNNEKADGNSSACYIAHHGIWQTSDQGRKLRVVFNASYHPSSSPSLNELLYAGPSLQNDLMTTIIRCRTYPIVCTSDIQMMYRQIAVDERDLNLQRIVWRNSDDQELKHYVLLIVTYGMSCAPYLALRTLR